MFHIICTYLKIIFNALQSHIFSIWLKWWSNNCSIKLSQKSWGNFRWPAHLHLHYIYAFSRRFYPKRLTVQSGIHFQYVCSLGIEPTTFCAANVMFYHWATRKLSKTTLQKLLDPAGLHCTTSERSGPSLHSTLHNFLSRPLSFLGWTTAMLF